MRSGSGYKSGLTLASACQSTKMRLLCIVVLAVGVANASSIREKRQTLRKKDVDKVEAICKDQGDEYFRLEDNVDCKVVYRCDRGRAATRLAKVKCPPSLSFDILRQTCDWSYKVKNCDITQRKKKVLPLLKTDEPLCPTDQLACGNGECIDSVLFCDGAPDCTDDSDENACEVGVDPNGSEICDTSRCALPDCFCSVDGTQIPQSLEPAQTPQMVTITFTGAVNVDNIGTYQDIFRDERQNPNGCTAKGTFYVSHKYTNYSAVQELHRKGHEIGVFSITNTDDPDYWSQGSYEVWRDEMAGARDIIENFANITDGTVAGVRAPQLRVGGNTQFAMMIDQQFVFDSSITAPFGRVPIWPYTFEYRMPHKCLGTSQNCPSQSHQIWEMVINELDLRDNPKVDERLPGCHLLSSCASINTPERFAKVLRNNFDHHYNTNRAPFGLHLTGDWLYNNKGFKKVLTDFIDEMQAKNDVYFVSASQVINWMQDPRETNSIRDFDAWKFKCEVKGLPECSLPNPCPLTTRELPGDNFYLNTCMECPKNYPWIEDYTGNGFAI